MTSKLKNALKSQEFFDENFSVLEKIGTGNYGKVYKIEEKKSKKFFSLKQIRVNKKEDMGSSIMEFMHRYVGFLSDSPYIVKIHFFFIRQEHETKSIFFNIVMENLEKTFKLVIEEHKNQGIAMDFKEILNFLNSIINGLEHLKQNHMAHRDIKPQNIMKNNDDSSYKLIDIHHKLESNLEISITDSALGTMNYLAPEIEGETSTQYDLFKADIFSLGITTLEACTLELGILNELRSNKYFIPRGKKETVVKNYGIELYLLLEKMIAENPEDRPSHTEIREFCFKINTGMENMQARDNLSRQKQVTLKCFNFFNDLSNKSSY